jgi:hypothetical protein
MNVSRNVGNRWPEVGGGGISTAQTSRSGWQYFSTFSVAHHFLSSVISGLTVYQLKFKLIFVHVPAFNLDVSWKCQTVYMRGVNGAQLASNIVGFFTTNFVAVQVVQRLDEKVLKIINPLGVASTELIRFCIKCDTNLLSLFIR